ncbi:hypothetical protein Rumeso_02818 [Rubellimicrobium mesophilum DSM 19309]|uniref:Uncharacterized protein n=1 Tax=Rubellimicrobium mesophilum DSM 19309 TaxID=442562 RepID=A0A017HM98_9RHOB|nr:hypothetical protein [Rubellimicrobium mesophilum]EYD75602.1 hypothetical protein Rumeso_02818 [Rubellimicrobium mesophilum DSM 19309]
MPTEMAAEPPAVVGARQRRPWLAAVAALLVVLAGLTAWATRPAGSEALPSIAVLPFKNLAGEPRWARLGQGLAAEIGTDLAHSKDIVVIPAALLRKSCGRPLGG